MDMPKEGSWEVRGGWVVNALVHDLGLTVSQAAGLAGNLGYESKGFEELQEKKPLVQGSAGGFGWVQWTGPRRRAFERWAADQDLAPTSDEANYGFLVHELRTSQAGFLMKLRKAASLADAVAVTHQDFERPSDVLDGTFRSYGPRLQYATRAFNGAQKIPATPVVVEVGATVRKLQKQLAELRLYEGRIDGDPGPLTQKALADWRLTRM